MDKEPGAEVGLRTGWQKQLGPEGLLEAKGFLCYFDKITPDSSEMFNDNTWNYTIDTSNA